MKSWKPRVSTVGLWISFLIALLFLLNFLMFAAYQKAYPDVGLWLQIWGYVESATFKTVTVSILLPLLLFVLESRFKLLETVYKNRLARESKVKEERRERRLEGITMSIQMWNQLYDSVTEVRYFQKKAKDDSGMKEILKKLVSIGSSGEDVVNLWGSRFGLASDLMVLFLVFINMLLQSAYSVGHYIEEIDRREDITDLQDSLGVIQEGITTVAHHPIVDILKHHMELRELEENGASNERVQAIRFGIDKNVTQLKDWSKELRILCLNHNKVLPAIEGEQVEAYREAAKTFEDWIHRHPGAPINEYEEFGDFRRAYSEIPHEKSVYASDIGYSMECIRRIADWFGFALQVQYLMRLANWPG